MKKTAKIFFYLIVITLAVCSINAQNAAKNWVFGNRARINFNGSPVASMVNTINTGEGSSSISDSSGQPLFHTDGITVWDKNNNPMPNGTGLKGHSSSTNSALIVPCNCGMYFIFTTDAVEDNYYSNGLRYSVVNMSANGGLGDVVAGSKNTLLLAPAAEKLAATGDGNGNFWVVAHAMKNNWFYSYHVIAGSDCVVSPKAVISKVGANYLGGNGDFGQGQMKISSDGKQLAAAAFNFTGPSFVELFSFNNITGTVSNFLGSSSTAHDTVPDGFYGVEFSPNTNYLYATTSFGANILYSYDISANTLSSRTLIKNFGSGNALVGALQLAPDGKIYVARNLKPYLDVLYNPNSLGGGWSGISFPLAAGSNSRNGLPSMVAGNFSCEGNTGCCDTMRVTPMPNPPLNQDYRTFEIFNPLSSSICSIEIAMQPLPPPINWQGGQAYQNLISGYPGTPVNFTFASNPVAYRRIPTTTSYPNMSAISNPPSSPAVIFNLGFDNTQPYSGTTILTINHCDGRKCVLEYKPWIVNPKLFGTGNVPWQLNIRELSTELSEITLVYDGDGGKGARWLGLSLPGGDLEIYSIAGPEAIDDKKESKKLGLSSSKMTANAALFEFKALLDPADRAQIGKTISLIIKKKPGLKIDPKQVRVTLFDEDANIILTGIPR